jgi:HEAT repeat protein
VYVGPVPPPVTDVRTISVSASDAQAWLSDLVEHGSTRAASDLILPLILVNGSEPWKLFLRLARDENRSREFKRNLMMWLSNAVSEHLGILDDGARTDDDEMRDQAVFVLSQRPKAEGVPALIDVAKASTHPSARKAAIYWLGQSGDPRAIDVYANLLGLR